MQVIPAINAASPEEAAVLVEKAKGFLKAGDWLHFDVSEINTWSSQDLKRSCEDLNIVNIEVHLMSSNYEEFLQTWLEAGAKRIIVQIEILKDLEYLLEAAHKFGAEVGLAVAPDTAVEELNVYLNKINFFQILAVTPGASGQPFQEKVVPKIRWLRQQKPNAIIEVDGGINLKTAELVRQAGADIIVSSSYIFNSADPALAYGNLTRQKT